MRFVCVHEDIGILVGCMGPRYTHLLVPTMHSRNRIGLNRESEILMNPGIIPPYAHAIGITRFERRHTLQLAQQKLSWSLFRQIDQTGAPAISTLVFS